MNKHLANLLYLVAIGVILANVVPTPHNRWAALLYAAVAACLFVFAPKKQHMDSSDWEKCASEWYDRAMKAESRAHVAEMELLNADIPGLKNDVKQAEEHYEAASARVARLAGELDESLNQIEEKNTEIASLKDQLAQARRCGTQSIEIANSQKRLTEDHERHHRQLLAESHVMRLKLMDVYRDSFPTTLPQRGDDESLPSYAIRCPGLNRAAEYPGA